MSILMILYKMKNYKKIFQFMTFYIKLQQVQTIAYLV